jgi:hypothetical protein
LRIVNAATTMSKEIISVLLYWALPKLVSHPMSTRTEDDGGRSKVLKDC